MVDADVLKKLDIFEGLTAPELKAVTEISEAARFPKGAMVFRENEEAKKLYVLLEGKVAIQFEVGRHLEAVVHTVMPGQAFGWSALVQPYQFTASARCTEDSRLVTVDREGIRKLLELDCHIGFIVMEKLAGLVSGR